MVEPGSKARERPPWRLPVMVAVAFVLLFFGIAALMHSSAKRAELRLGEKFFSGAQPLTARMVGHELALPAQTVSCKNCHRAGPGGAPRTVPTQKTAAPTEAFAPRLSRNTLIFPLKRRGGPASIYDAVSFCRVLVEGIDPANVMVPQIMPRYTITQQDCDALWAYVTAN